VVGLYKIFFFSSRLLGTNQSSVDCPLPHLPTLFQYYSRPLRNTIPPPTRFFNAIAIRIRHTITLLVMAISCKGHVGGSAMTTKTKPYLYL